MDFRAGRLGGVVGVGVGLGSVWADGAFLRRDSGPRNVAGCWGGAGLRRISLR